LIGFANQPTVNGRPVGRFPTSANLGIPEITVPAGFNQTVYEPRFALNLAKTAYVTVANETEAAKQDLPLPVGISFWAGAGGESSILKVAAAYELATHHRKPAAAFGPLAARPREVTSQRVRER
jgi:Asp-tRNA(Asn)/Glu-tRNA(Gln) amidotransferase A subunit family amidase